MTIAAVPCFSGSRMNFGKADGEFHTGSREVLEKLKALKCTHLQRQCRTRPELVSKQLARKTGDDIGMS